MDVAALTYPHGLVGTTIEQRYRIESVIGQGAMGTVFRGHQLTLNRPVAVKILRPDLENDQTQRFLREANIIAQLEHRNCVAVFDYGCSEEGLHFLAMQLLEGHPLSDELGAPMLPLRACELIADVFRGLAHAHSRNVVHRDLKPDNLFVSKDEEGRDCVKLLDFGIAKFKQPYDSSEGAMTLSGLMSGTPAYMSPEQVIGAETDERTDLYSAGMVLYEMLAGAPPFLADDPVMLLQMRLNQDLPPLPDSVPRELREIVTKLCHEQRAKRYPSAPQALEDIEAFVAEATGMHTMGNASSTRRWTTNDPRGGADYQIMTTPGGDLMPMSEGKPKRQWWMVAAAAAVVVVGAAIAVPRMATDDASSESSSDVPAVAATSQGLTEPADTATPRLETGVDRSGMLLLLAKVNDPSAPLRYDARWQMLDTLESSEFAAKIDRRLQTALDLRQADQSPTPCTTFRRALTEIQRSGDPYYAPAVQEAQVPSPGAGESDRDCVGLSDSLQGTKKRVGVATQAAPTPVVADAQPRSRPRPSRRRARISARHRAEERSAVSVSVPAPGPKPEAVPAASKPQANKGKRVQMKKLGEDLKGI